MAIQNFEAFSPVFLCLHAKFWLNIKPRPTNTNGKYKFVPKTESIHLEKTKEESDRNWKPAEIR